MKLSSKTLQNLPYFWNMNTQIVFFLIFHLEQLWICNYYLQWMQWSMSTCMANVEAFHQTISSSINHLFLKCVSLKKQNEAPLFNGLRVYILICMVFMSFAMMYYGLILFKLRRTSKEESAVRPFNEKDAHFSDLIIKWDRIIFVIYLITFIFFNFSYFIIYLAQN